MDDTFRIPCLVCNKVVSCDNSCFSSDQEKCTLFLLGNLLEIPKPRRILNGEADSDREDEDFDGEDNYWNVVRTCEGCETTVGEASLIYKEIREQARKFWGIQRQLVETFKKSRESLSAPISGNDKRLHNFIKQCQQIINKYDFNEFGLPFIVKEEDKVIPDDLVGCSDNQGYGGDEVIVKKEKTETQQILLIFPDEENDKQQNEVDSENEADPDFEEDDNDDDYRGDNEEMEKDGSSSEEDTFVKPSKPTKVRTRRPSPKRKQPRRQKLTAKEYKWPCPLCHFKLKTSNSLKVHLKTVHPNNTIDFNQLKLKYLQVNPSGDNPPPPSEVLRKAAQHLGVSPFELEYPHLNCKRNSKGKFPCPWTDPSQCPKIFGTKIQLIRHLKVKHLKLPLFTCSWSETEGGPVCGRTFATQNNYKYHMDEHRGTPKYKCEKCNMTFYKRNYLTRHTQLTHLNEKFICEICGQEFSCKDYLNSHKHARHKDNPDERTTTGEGSEVICDLCGKRFQSRSTLKTHVVTFHEKEKGKCCHLCDKRFGQTIHLNIHLWARHRFKAEGFQPKAKVARKDKFQCEVTGCRMVLSTKKGLEKHRRKFHGEDGNKPGAFNCKYCGKNFFQRTKWQQCERTHENKESRPEKCEVCGKGFPTRDHLKFHLRHTHKMKLEKEPTGRK